MSHEVLTPRRLNRALLARQWLLTPEPMAPLELIERLVGLQAQQARPPFVGLWSRIPGFRREELRSLCASGEVVRASLMRCTLHLMSRRDYLRFRPVLQPALTGAMRSILRDRLDSFDLAAVLDEARKQFAERPRTFTELRAALVAAFPEADERAMGYAVRTQLPLTIVPTDHEWGYHADGRFALEPALAEAAQAEAATPHELVLRYLAAFGPATAADVQAWSGLSGAAQVLSDLRPRLAVFRDERKRELFDLPSAPRPPEETPVPVRLVAEFDNLLLAHADRSRIIADEHRKVVVTKNGLVLGTFLVDGFVAGTWKAARSRKSATLTLTPFQPLTGNTRAELEAEGQRLLEFLEPEAATRQVEFAAP